MLSSAVLIQTWPAQKLLLTIGASFLLFYVTPLVIVERIFEFVLSTTVILEELSVEVISQPVPKIKIL